jgi:hypothetical protein
MEVETEISIKEEDGKIIFGKTTFEKPIRTFYVSVTDLRVLEDLSTVNNHNLDFRVVLRGQCYLDDRGIGIIGSNGIERKFSIVIKGSDEDTQKRDEVEHSKKHNIFDPLPKTRSYVGFSKADWEIGNKDDWYVEVFIPHQAINKLVEHVRAGRLNVLSVGLDLEDAYTDSYHAPPSVPVAWYLKPDKYGSPSTHGQVRTLSFYENTQSLELPKFRKTRFYDDEDAEQPEEAGEAKPDIAETALKLAEAQIAQTSYMVRSLKRLTTAVIIMTVVLAIGLLT